MNQIKYKKQQMMNSTMLTNESGRSMVEMLGVLAVIGVLSVGGIAGYTSAMNKHRANELLHQVSMRAATCMAQLASGNTSLSVADFGDYDGYSFAAATAANNKFTITITGKDGKTISETVCNNMKNALPSTVQMTNLATCADVNSITLTYEDGTGGGGNAGSNKGNAGATEDDDDAVCSGTRPGACSVCRKTYTDATAGHWYDSDALCTTAGQTCVDGTCVESAKDEPTLSGPLCKCMELWGDHYCGGEIGKYDCSSDADCARYGTWDDTQEKCVVENSCTNNSDCTSDEYCHYTSVDDGTCKPDKKGTCVKKADAKGDFASGTTAEADGFIRSSGTMDWFSAQNFCRSYGKNLVTLSQMGLENAVPSGKSSCSGTGTNACQNIDATGWSAIQVEFGTDFYPWTANLVPSSSCNAFYVPLDNSYATVYFTNRSGALIYGAHHVLCK